MATPQQHLTGGADKAQYAVYGLQLAALLGFLLMPSLASAAPWDEFSRNLACTMTGPWVKWMAVLAIAIGGLMFGLGELNGPFGTVLRIAGGFSIALGAVSIATLLFNSFGPSTSMSC